MKNDDVIKLLEEHHALTHAEIKKHLEQKNSVLIHLRSMLKANKIKAITMPVNSRCKHKFLRTYAGLQLFYINDEHLKQWLNKYLPEKPSPAVKQAITMRMRKDFRKLL